MDRPVTHDQINTGSSITGKPNGMFVPAPDTAYNRKQQQVAMDARKNTIIKDITELEADIKAMPNDIPITKFMDVVERVIRSCGGDTKVQFLDVSHTFIKVLTRVPLTANLFQFLPEGEDNPRYHKVVTKIFMQIPFVSEVRWLPNENGAVLLVNVERLA